MLFVKKKFFVLVDEALGDAACDAVFDVPALTARTSFKGGGKLPVQSLTQPGPALEKEEGWGSFKYGTRPTRLAFRFGMKKTAYAKGLRFVTLLVPFEVPLRRRPRSPWQATLMLELIR